MNSKAILLLPLLLLLLLAGLLMRKPDAAPAPFQANGSTAGESGAVWESVDFSNLKPGDFPPGWDRAVGTFQVVRSGDRAVLEMGAEPMTEGSVLRTRIMHGGGAVRARMRGERGKRAFPRFCVGLHGEAVYQVRANPGKRVLELITGENVLASVPWPWRENEWLWLELRMSPAGPAGGELEGRAWAEGTERPAEPQVSCRITESPGMVRAALHGAPYAGRPIHFDRIETAPAASR